MKRTLITIVGMILFIVVAYFVYDLLKASLSPCETIFEQTSLQLTTKLNVVQTSGEVLVGREKVQELTEAAQVTALNLKACCIVLNAGKVDSGQFLQCKDATKRYEAQVDTVIAKIGAAEEAKAAGNAQAVAQQTEQIREAVDAAKTISEDFGRDVDAISKPGVVTEQPATVAQQPGAERKAATDSGLKLTAVLRSGADALAEGVIFEVYEAKKDLEGKRHKITHSYDAQPLFKLPAGRYYVVASHGAANATAEVEVGAGGLTEQILTLNAGYLRLASIAVDGAEQLDRDLSYEVFAARKDLQGNRQKITHSYDAQPLFKLPAGGYHVAVSHGSANASAEVEVAAGELTEHVLTLNVGYLRVFSVPVEGGQRLEDGVAYEVFEARKDLAGNRQKVTYSYDGQPLFKLPAGRYYVAAALGSAYGSAEVEVRAGELAEQVLNLNAGYLRVSSTAGGGRKLDRNVTYEVYEAEKDVEGNRRKLTYSYDAEPLFKLPAGRYYVVAGHNDVYANAEVELAAGESKDVTMEIGK